MELFGYHFSDPEFFWLLLLIPLMLVWYYWKIPVWFAKTKIPTLNAFGSKKRSFRELSGYFLPVFRSGALFFLILALARPQSLLEREKITTHGIDIVIAMDVSSSMLAKDFRPNRLEAAKEVGMKFISGRTNDRIGLVVFARESFTQCPITMDHQVVRNLLKEIKSGLIEDGTAIGMGLATSVDRLRNSEAKSKVIILLTDGVNNSGFIDPETATEMAQSLGIRVYTVGIGSIGKALYPVQTPFGKQLRKMEVKIDEKLLKKIASGTGGQYFRATHNQKLKEIYREIDRLEKTKIEVSAFKRYSEEFLPFALAGGLLFVLEWLLRFTRFKKLP